jgi:hypothetical protein
MLATQEEIRKIGLKPAWGKWFMRPYLEKIQHKKGLAG